MRNSSLLSFLMSINLIFKVSGGSSFEASFDPETTIGDVKKNCVKTSGVPAEQQRLIYKGRILKDTDTINQHKIESGHTIHLVKGAAPAGSSAQPAAPPPAAGQLAEPIANPTPPPSSSTTARPTSDYMQQGMAQGAMMQDPRMMSQMMQSPMVQQAMQVGLQCAVWEENMHIGRQLEKISGNFGKIVLVSGRT